MSMWDGMAWHMGWVWLWLVLVLVGIVVLVVVLVRLLGHGGRDEPGHSSSPQPPAGPSARKILDERFARGEIDSEEYQERRRHLEDGT